jgi:DNA polymerase-3 subunit epsilon
VASSGYQSLEPQAEYHPSDGSPKLVAAVVDVETTGTNPHRDKIIELGICLFEYDRQSGRIYRVLGSWEWLENPDFSIPPEITKITGITDERSPVIVLTIAPSMIC